MANDKKEKNKKVKNFLWNTLIVLISLAMIATLVWGYFYMERKNKDTELAYTELIKQIDEGKIEKIEILQNEYYETEQDLMALLLKAPILDDFSEVNNEDFEHKPRIEQDIFEAYVKKYKTEKGILLKRVLYGIVAKKEL